MKSLIGFELEKILKKRILWITFIIFLLLQLLLTCGAYIFASRYVDGRFYERKADWYKTDRKNSENLSGRKIDDSLLSELSGSYKYVPGGEKAESYEYLKSDDYQKKVRPYEPLDLLVKAMLQSNQDSNPDSVTQDVLYKSRREGVKQRWDIYNLSDSEKEYWSEKEGKLPGVFTYKYGGAFTEMADMGGCYYICMFVTFFIAICITSIFTEEHLRKTDQLILCTRYGRKETFMAKMAAGCIVTVCAVMILWAVTFIAHICTSGPGEADAMVQVSFLPFYSGSLKIGQTVLIMTVILLVSSIILCIITMALSELLNNNVGTMAIIIAVAVFFARLVQIPPDSKFSFLGKIWNLLPMNLLKADEGFFDIRLFNIAGVKFTTWQIALPVYVITGLVFILIGKRKYCRYQVNGR